MAHALIHVLGSRAGYTTLDATPGVSTGERAELEILSFGDATNAEAMSRLETSASMIGRRLRSGRFAISRMLPGGTDDAGRPTIEVISLIVDSAAYAAVVGAIHRLAADVRFWRLARASVSRGYALPEEAVRSAPNDPQVLRAYDGWVAARRQGGTAVLGDADAAGLFAMVALLDAQDLGECRWGVGVLSLSAPVDVCTLAPTAASIGPRPVLRVAPGAAWLNREMEFASLHAARNRLLPPSAALATAVRIEPALDRSAIAVPVGEPDGRGSEFSRRPRNLTHIAGVTAAASFALLGVMVVVYARGGGGARPEAPLALETTPSEGADAAKTPGGGAYDGIPKIPPAEAAASGASPGAKAEDSEAVAGTAASPPAVPERPVTPGGSGAGDPTSTPHDSSSTPPTPLPETPRNPDAISVKVPDKPTASEPAVTPRDGIADAAAQLRRIRTVVSDRRLDLVASNPTPYSASFKKTLSDVMTSLLKIEQEIFALQARMHADCSKVKLPHRFALTIWPGKCKDSCCDAVELWEPWDSVLVEFDQIRLHISNQREQLLNAVRADARNRARGERAAKAQESDIRELFGNALSEGPKHLLDKDALQAEWAALEKRKPKEAKP